MEQSALIDRMKMLLGSPSDDEMGVSIYEFAIEDALAQLDRVKPKFDYRQLPLVSGQQAYTLEDDVHSVAGCWITFDHGTGINFSSEFSFINDSLVPSTYWHNPSLITLLEQKFESWDRVTNHSYEYNPDGNTLFILPSPESTGLAIYRASIKRELSNIPYKYAEGFRDLCLANAMETLSAIRSRTGSIPVCNGSISFDTSTLPQMAKDKRTDAFSKLGIGGGDIVIG